MKPESLPSSRALEQEQLYKKLRKRLDDPRHLPSIKELKAIFHYSWHHGNQDDWNNYLGRDTKLGPKTQIYKLNYDSKVRYEILTKEHVEGLANYLNQRAKEVGATEKKPLKILEVGAGDGRLAHFLKEKTSTAIDIQAMDSGERKIKPDFPVEIIPEQDNTASVQTPIQQSIKKYQPDIVISSWMSKGEDWTKTFRDEESVDEYILIGDPDLCGDSWRSWGLDNNLDSNRPPEQADYHQAGWQAAHLTDIEDFQVCCNDSFPDDEIKHSLTVSFRRQQPK